MESVHIPFQQPSIRYPRETPSSDEEQKESSTYYTPTEEPDDDTVPHLSLADCDATRNFGPGSSVCKSGLVTGKRPEKDRTQTY